MFLPVSLKRLFFAPYPALAGVAKPRKKVGAPGKGNPFKREFDSGNRIPAAPKAYPLARDTDDVQALAADGHPTGEMAC